MERHFHEELKEVNDLLLAMSNLVVTIFDTTVEAFIKGDDKIDAKIGGRDFTSYFYGGKPYKMRASQHAEVLRANARGNGVFP